MSECNIPSDNESNYLLSENIGNCSQNTNELKEKNTTINSEKSQRISSSKKIKQSEKKDDVDFLNQISNNKADVKHIKKTGAHNKEILAHSKESFAQKEEIGEKNVCQI